jgi:hypothetical protein
VSAERLRELVREATPGPWGWPHDNALAGDFAGGYDSEWALVAAIHDAGRVTEADARLIALAPEMAALLADAVAFMRYFDTEDEISQEAQAWLTRLDALVAAKEEK